MGTAVSQLKQFFKDILCYHILPLPHTSLPSNLLPPSTKKFVLKGVQLNTGRHFMWYEHLTFSRNAPPSPLQVVLATLEWFLPLCEHYSRAFSQTIYDSFNYSSKGQNDYVIYCLIVHPSNLRKFLRKNFYPFISFTVFVFFRTFHPSWQIQQINPNEFRRFLRIPGKDQRKLSFPHNRMENRIMYSTTYIVNRIL